MSSSVGTNLLLITLDTTRADHLGCYGYAAASTSNLDRLAREGVVAEQAIAVAPLTLPSHASIFTSRYPPSHGIRDNADYRLPESELTLAEVLKKHGYRTEAVVASVVLDSSLGLAQGFDAYDEPRARPETASSGTAVAYRPILERKAAEVTDAALAALRRTAGGPFFLWVHYFDPHNDYDPPEPYAGRFAAAPYDGEIAYVDAEIGRVLAELQRAERLDRTLVVVVADHGESLGEHGEMTHGLLLYDAALRVPLIFRLPGVVPQGARTQALVSGVDLAPTILELLSLPALPRAQGSSVAAIVRGEKSPGDRPAAYAETLLPERSYGWSALFAIREGKKKMIRAPERELYDLGGDPAERENLAARMPELASRLAERLATMERGFGEPDGAADAPMSEEQRERLASLGYLPGGPSSAPAGEKRDPKRMVAQHNAMLEAQSLLSSGHPREARVKLERVLAADPGNPAAASLLGTLLFAGGDRTGGLVKLEAAARAAPGFYQNQRNLANAYHVLGRYEEAAKAWRAAIAIRPASPEDRYAYGNVLFALGDARGAVAAYEESARLAPAAPGLDAALGVALEAVGERVRAREALARSVARAPGLTGAWIALGRLEGRDGRWNEALAAYDGALRAEPGSGEALFGRARALFDLGRLAEGESAARQWLSAHPSNRSSDYLRGRVLLASGDRAGAEAALRRFAANPSADPDLLTSARALLEARTR